jgi:hypothetical protein
MERLAVRDRDGADEVIGIHPEHRGTASAAPAGLAAMERKSGHET